MTAHKRTRLSRLDMLAVMARQATCPWCGERLGSLDGLHDDHVVPLALGGTNALDNRQLLHAACHAEKTNGGVAKATTLGSDVHAIWKVKRVSEEHEAFRRRLLAKSADETEGGGRPASTAHDAAMGRQPSPSTASKPRGRKIPSRPFRTRKKETSK